MPTGLGAENGRGLSSQHLLHALGELWGRGSIADRALVTETMRRDDLHAPVTLTDHLFAPISLNESLDFVYITNNANRALKPRRNLVPLRPSAFAQSMVPLQTLSSGELW